MTMSLLALVAIPEMRISDKGLVDVVHFTFIPVIVPCWNRDYNEGPAE
jgi:adenine deaminase